MGSINFHENCGWNDALSWKISITLLAETSSNTILFQFHVSKLDTEYVLFMTEN